MSNVWLDLSAHLLLLLLQQEVPDGGARVAAAAELGPAEDVAGRGLLAGRVGVAPTLAALGEVVEVLAAELLGHAVIGGALVGGGGGGGGRGGGRDGGGGLGEVVDVDWGDRRGLASWEQREA